MANELELLPCPAGHPIAQVCDSDRKMFYVVCVHAECFWTLGEGYDAYAMPDHSFTSEEDAIAAWNTRAVDLSKDMFKSALKRIGRFACKRGTNETCADQYAIAVKAGYTKSFQQELLSAMCS